MRFLISIICIFPLTLFCQVNLVPNSNFEGKNYCPSYASDLGGAGVLQNWYEPNVGTTDYFHQCTYPDLYDLQVPHSDSAYIGIAIYDPNGSNTREYVSTQLLDSLFENKYYLIEFYCSLAENLSRFSSNNLATYFSDTALHSTTPYYFDFIPSLKYFNNEVIDDTVNWIKVSGIYQAHGGEKFLTLGNFNLDTETVEGPEYTNGFIAQAYYIIDDVSVIPLDSIVGGISIHAGPDQTVYIGDTVFIGEKITNLPANWFKLDGTPVATNTSGLYVWPEETTTYVVTMTLNGFYSTDTVTVFVEGVGIEEEEAIDVLVYPIPNTGTFQLNGDLSIGDKIEIFNSNGKLIVQEEVLEEGYSFNLPSTLAPGLYTLTFRSVKNNFNTQKLLIH